MRLHRRLLLPALLCFGSLAALLGYWQQAAGSVGRGQLLVQETPQEFLRRRLRLPSASVQFTTAGAVLRSPAGRRLSPRSLLPPAAAESPLDRVHCVLPDSGRLAFHQLLSLLAVRHWRRLLANASADARWEEAVVMATRRPPATAYGRPVAGWRSRRLLAAIEAVAAFGGWHVGLDTVPVRPPPNHLLDRCPAVVADDGLFVAWSNATLLRLWHLCFQAQGSWGQWRRWQLWRMLHRWLPQLATKAPSSLNWPPATALGARLLFERPTPLAADEWKFAASPAAPAIVAVRLRSSLSRGLLASQSLANVSELDSGFGELARLVLTGSWARQRQRGQFVHTPLRRRLLLQRLPLLRQVVAELAGSPNASSMMTRRLPQVDTSSWELEWPNGTRQSVQQVQAATRAGDFRVPSIAHYVLPFRDPQLQFHHFVCLLSGFWAARARLVVLWYSRPPAGRYWRLLRRNLTSAGVWQTRVLLARRPLPTSVYGRPAALAEHQSDIMRLEAVLTFGGVYFDLDVVALKPLEPLRRYDFAIGRETDVGLCNGVFLAAANSSLLALWHLAYQTFDDRQWIHHSVLLPQLLCDAFPDLCHVEELSLDRPNWTTEELEWIYGRRRRWDWRRRNYAVHLWYRFHGRQYDLASVRRVDSMLGDIFRFVLFGNSSLGAGGSDTDEA